VDTRKNILYVGTGNSSSDPPSPQSDAIVALSLDDGRMLWSKQLAYAGAYNLACGTLRESTNCPDSSGEDYDFGASPILVELPDGRRALVAGQKSGWVHAIDPDRQGQVLWQRRLGRGGVFGGIQWGPAADHNNVYVAISDVDDRRRLLPSGDSVRELNPFSGGGYSGWISRLAQSSGRPNPTNATTGGRAAPLNQPPSRLPAALCSAVR
jgi:polyvinyl alcohol dehydrogenase (cytochrome)